MLGVVFDLSLMSRGQAFVTNKPERIESITQVMKGAELIQKMTSGDAASLRGKLGFAEAQCYGRIASRSMRRLGEIASGARSGTQLDQITLSALGWLMERLVNASPRPLLADANENVVLIFTVAAAEGDLHTSGGVLLDKSAN